jgi:lipoate-protein ligase A
MTPIFYDHSFSSGAENLALEELLLRPFIKDAEAIPVVRMWDNPETCVVLGRAEKIQQQVNLEATEQLKIPVYRRVSGGGTVTHGKGNLNLSFFLPFSLHEELSNLKASYAMILNWVQMALHQSCGVSTTIDGTCDLCVGNRKISGTAQARKRHGLLHHLTILVDFDTSVIAKIQSEPEKQPEYRQHRAHDDFITTLHQEGYALDRKVFTKALAEVMGGLNEAPLNSSTLNEVKDLAQWKYRSCEWTHEGREPKK